MKASKCKICEEEMPPEDHADVCSQCDEAIHKERIVKEGERLVRLLKEIQTPSKFRGR